MRIGKSSAFSNVRALDYVANHYAERHLEYLRNAHPQAFQSMRDDGTLVAHVRRRGVEAAEMRDRLQAQMKREIEEGTRDAATAEHVAEIAAELVSDFVRSL